MRVAPLALPLVAALGAHGCWLGPWPDTGMEDANVGFLYVGPVGDHGWTKAHADGRLYLEEQLDGVSSHYEPSVLEADALGVMEDFIGQGDNIIVTTSFDFLSPTQSAAANYADVNFLNCSGFVSSPNLGSYFGRMYQAWYLAGIVAGTMTETDRIGVVGPVVIPETVRHLNALTLGARSVNEDVQVQIEWIHNWFDTELEPEVTNQLLEAEADIIVSKTDTTIPQDTVQAARGKGLYKYDIWSIGYDNEDSCTNYPDSCLTAPYWNWGPLYARLVEQMMQGSWDPHELVWDQIQAVPEDSTIYLAELHSVVPDALAFEIETSIARLAEDDNIRLPFSR